MRRVQLRDAKAALSALVEKAARGEPSVITRRGKPRAVLLGVEEWDRLCRVPSFGRLLVSAPLEEADLPARCGTCCTPSPSSWVTYSTTREGARSVCPPRADRPSRPA